MRYAKINKMDIANGVGISVSVFWQGCNFKCNGCFNKETWDYNGGKEWNKDIEDRFIELCKKPYINCVSMLGGEPFDQDEHLYYLLHRIKNEVNKPIYLWTGYKYEYLLNNTDVARDILKEGLIDVLIDGQFECDKLDFNLKLRGSYNQRIIDIQKTINNDSIITLD